MGESNASSIAKERWNLQLPGIVKQANVEALQHSDVSQLLQGSKDNISG